MAVPENIEELAHLVRTAIHGREVRESLASSMEATADVADWSRKVAQDIIDGNFNEGELYTEIERKLNELEADYAPQLNTVKTNIEKTNEKMFYDSMVNKKKPKGMITWIDDDGHEGVYSKLKKFSEEFGIPFTSAIITDRGFGYNNDNGINYMTLEQMRELEGLGFEFVCHTHTHNINHKLTDMTEEEIHEELSTSKQIIKSYGWNDDVLVYPFGAENELVRDITRQYFECAIDTNNTPGPYNSGNLVENPFDQFRIERVNAEVPNERVLPMIQKAMNENKWIILVSHVDQGDWYSDAKVREVIEYALSLNLEFVTVEEGIKRYGNLAQFGDTIISNDGGIYGKSLGRVRMTRVGDYPNNAPITAFPTDTVTYIKVRVLDMNEYNLPNANPGIIEVYRDIEDSFSYQKFTSLYVSDEKRIWYRRWNTDSQSWGDWYTSEGSIFTKVGDYPNNAPITAFPVNKKTFLKVRGVDASDYNLSSDTYINGLYGRIETYRDTEDDYSYQKFISIDNQYVFYRMWNLDTNTWGRWSSRDFNKLTKVGDYPNNAPISVFPIRKTTIIKIRNVDASDYGLSGSGILETYRDNEDSYSYQKFTSPRNGQILLRYWNTDSSTWSNWNSVNN